MAYKFLDATGAWSDPAKTTYKYLRGDGVWAAPDTSHKFLDATGAWSVPELELKFDEMTWAQLAAESAKCASNSSKYQSLLGKTKDVEVTGLGVVKARLIGINHDTYAAGGKAGFTFQLTDGLSTTVPTTFRMNSSVRTGGWRDCEMRSTNLPKLKAALPSDLRSVIKSVTKQTSITSTGEGTIVSTTDDLFLLSLYESIGTNTDLTNSYIENYIYKEGTQYEYYKANPGAEYRKIKNSSGVVSDASWLRTLLNSTNQFLSVDANGMSDISNYYLVNVAALPAAAFCI